MTPQRMVTAGWFDVHHRNTTTQEPVYASVVQLLPETVTGPAVVICESYGMEGVAADRALNALSLALMSNGHPVVRFRPPGLGDSIDGGSITKNSSDPGSSDPGSSDPGSDPGSNMASLWLAAATRATDLAHSLAPDYGVSLFGLRLGATIAGLVAATRTDIDSVALWAPISGKRFLREQRLLGASAATRSLDASETAGYGMDAAGFHLDPSDVSAISSLDLAGIGPLPQRSIIVIDRDDVPSSAAIATELGADEPAGWPGFSALRLDTPEEGEIPDVVIGRFIEWLKVNHGPRRPSIRLQEAPVLLSDIPVGPGTRERIAAIPIGSAVLHAVITKPSRFDAPPTNQTHSPVMVILSTGANPCSGPGRAHVELARRWAAQRGLTTVRIDRRGVGVSCLMQRTADPSTEETRADLDAYDDDHLLDLLDIERFIHQEFPGRRYVLVGICSGAFSAFNAVRVGAKPSAIVSANQIIFDATEWADRLESPIYALKARSQLSKSINDPRSWVRLAKGDIPIKPAVRRLVAYARMRNDAGKTGTENPRDINCQMEAMAARGVKQLYLFDEAETGLAYIRFRASPLLDELTANGLCQFHTTEFAGHTFGTPAARHWLGETIDDNLSRLGVT
jgi:alpha-beta hydrolase superfamily lysophospholipase